MDREPTKEEIREFWEWCGLTLIPHTDRYSSGTQNWIEYQYGGTRVDKPELDLTNLFRYAVPALNEKLDRHIQLTQVMSGWECNIGLGDITYTDDDPAMALFWAIWEVIKGMD